MSKYKYLFGRFQLGGSFADLGLKAALVLARDLWVDAFCTSCQGMEGAKKRYLPSCVMPSEMRLRIISKVERPVQNCSWKPLGLIWIELGQKHVLVLGIRHGQAG